MGFRWERIIAGGFIIAAVLFCIGALVANPPRQALPISNIDMRERAFRLGYLICSVSVVLAAILLVLGLCIAFGVGPSFLSRRVSGAVVRERMMQTPEGHTVFEGEVLDDARCYLRLLLPDGEVAEYICDPTIYRASRVGSRGEIRCIGGRLISFAAYPDPGNAKEEGLG